MDAPYPLHVTESPEMAEIIEKFEARSEGGETFEVHKHQHFTVPLRPLSDRSQQRPGRIEYVLSDGRSLKALDADAGTFEIVATSQVIRKI